MSLYYGIEYRADSVRVTKPLRMFVRDTAKQLIKELSNSGSDIYFAKDKVYDSNSKKIIVDIDAECLPN